MASFRKRGSSWYVEVCVKGHRSSATFPTKGQAKEWANEKESEFRSQTCPAIPSQKTVEDLLTRYRDEVSPHKKGARWEKIRLNKLLKDPLAKVKVADLSAAHLSDWRDRRLKDVSGGSVNRELNLLSAIFNRAKKEWLWLRNNPVSDIKRPPRPKPRDVRLDDDTITQITQALTYSGVVENKLHLIALYFLIAIETAMRLNEICTLQKEHIHINDRYVTLIDSKNGDKRHVPLSNKAQELMQQYLDTELTITNETASTLFRRYMKRAGIEGIHFHDSRHEALTRLAQKLEVLDLARMVGHRDPRSLMIYYNATATEIASRLD